MHRRLFAIFLFAFFLNLLWEQAHSVLYLHYQGEAITFFRLLRCALFDATVTTLFALPFLNIRQLQGKEWLIVVPLFLFAVLLEAWALSTGRWAYSEAMPLIYGIGVTPALQLALLGYIALRATHSLALKR